MAVFLILLLLSFSAFAEINQTVEVGLSDVRPFSYMENGKLKGINLSIFDQLKIASKLNFDYNLYPHARLKKDLEKGSADLTIIFKNICLAHDKYEVQTELYSLKPMILIKKSVNPKKQAIRVARVLGMCQQLADENVRKDLLTEVASMDQAFKMLQAGRIDGICGNAPLVDYNIQHYKEFQKKLVIYRVQNSNDFDAVICRKKDLSIELKRKLELAAKKIVIPHFKHIL